MGTKKDKMRILVTGGGGFIGKALILRLISEGYDVASLSRGEYPELGEAGIKHYQVDLLNQKALDECTKNIDVVFHVAAKAGFWGPYSDYYRNNVLGTLNIIEACKINGVSKLIFTGSASVIFDGKNIEGGNEDLPYPKKGLSAYTETKALAEKAVLDANSSGLRTLSLRPHLVWGPGDNHILPRILEQAGKGKLRIIGDAKNVVDTTYIDNCVEAHMCALKLEVENQDAWGRAYFVSDDEPVLLWELLNNMLIINGLKPLRKSVPRRFALNMAFFMEKRGKLLKSKSPPAFTRFLVHELTASHWFNISSAKDILGYRPVLSIEEGLKALNNRTLDDKPVSLTFYQKLKLVQGFKLTARSVNLAWQYSGKALKLIKDAGEKLGQEASQTKEMAEVFFRLLEEKLDMKNRKEPPSEEEVRAAIEQLKDVGRFSLFATVSILPGGGFSLIGLELLARRLGVKKFTLIPSSFRKESGEKIKAKQ